MPQRAFGLRVLLNFPAAVVKTVCSKRLSAQKRTKDLALRQRGHTLLTLHLFSHRVEICLSVKRPGCLQTPTFSEPSTREASLRLRHVR